LTQYSCTQIVTSKLKSAILVPEDMQNLTAWFAHRYRQEGEPASFSFGERAAGKLTFTPLQVPRRKNLHLSFCWKISRGWTAKCSV
jgi:hypothetical protein